jgi:hypothetical protein
MSNIILTKNCHGRDNNTPRSYMQSIYLNIPKVEKRRKIITDKEFVIPSNTEYSKLVEINYKVNQLKKICKHYKLKLSGNKNELTTRIYNFLRFYYYVSKIHSVWKKYILRIYNNLRGPARYNRSICINETDFFSMEPLRYIPYSQFISFTDDIENKIYGFEIISIYNLYSKCGKKPKNPYNRNILPKNIKKKLDLVLKLGKIFGDEININIEEPEQLTTEKLFELRVLTLFQNIDELGNYTHSTWFLSLNRPHLIRYLRELLDIWSYRANLSDLTKREICPPIGNPFRSINIHNLPTLSFNDLRNKSIGIMEYMVNRGVNQGSRALGANYVLCALTLVNYDAAQNLPWLYQSVAHF